jgi:hypothetical protein
MKAMLDACIENMEANPGEMLSKVEHEKVPKEEAAVKPVGALRKRHRGRHLPAGCRGKLNIRTQGKGGCRRKLATTSRKMIRCAGLAWCQGQCRQGHGRDDVV